MKTPFLARVLCPKCTRAGGLVICQEYTTNTIPWVIEGEVWLKVCQVPVMSCFLPGCGMRLVGRIEGNDAVFPDPHVLPGMLQK